MTGIPSASGIIVYAADFKDDDELVCVDVTYQATARFVLRTPKGKTLQDGGMIGSNGKQYDGSYDPKTYKKLLQDIERWFHPELEVHAPSGKYQDNISIAPTAIKLQIAKPMRGFDATSIARACLVTEEADGDDE